MQDVVTLKDIKNKIIEIEKLENKFNNKKSIEKLEFSKYNDLLFIFTELNKRIESIKLALPSLEEKIFGIKVWKNIYKLKNLKDRNKINKYEKVKNKLINKINLIETNNEEDKIKKQDIIEILNEELK